MRSGLAHCDGVQLPFKPLLQLKPRPRGLGPRPPRVSRQRSQKPTAPPFLVRHATLAVEESRAVRRAKSGDRAAALVAPSIVQMYLRAGFPLCSQIFPLQRRFSDRQAMPVRPTLAPGRSMRCQRLPPRSRPPGPRCGPLASDNWLP